MHIERILLPGVGIRFDLLLADGQRVGVVEYQRGGRELFIARGEDDPVATVRLDDAEAVALSDLLGGGVTTHEVSHLRDAARAVAVDWIPIEASNPFIGATLGESDVEGRSGAAVVAVIRNGDVISCPDAGTVLEGGDVLVVLGPQEALERAAHLLGNSG